MPKIRYFSLFWGKEYCDAFLNFSLPGVIAEANRTVLENQRYVFYTTKEDFEYLIRNEDFKFLDGIMDVKIFDIAELIKDKTSTINEIFKHAFKTCLDEGFIFRHIPCDSIISNNALVNSFKPIESGKKAVFMPTGALRVLWGIRKPKKALSALELAVLFKDNIHPETESHFISNDYFFPNPCQIIDEKDGNIYIKSFFMQPQYLVIEKEFNFTNVEWDLINNYHIDEVYFIKDSLEAFEVALTKPDYARHRWPKRNCENDDVNNMIVRYGNDHTLKCFEEGYIIYAY